MKKKLLPVLCVVLVLIVVLALVVGILAYLELSNPVIRRVHVDMTAEEILAEMPEAAVSENDMALRDTLYADEAVQTAFADLTDPAEGVGVDAARVRALQESYCPQAEGMRINLCSDERAYVTYYCGERFIYMAFTADGVMFKSVYVEDGKDDFIRYDCDADGNLTKKMTKRIPFGFFKYRNQTGPEYEPNPFHLR